jgi:hypothetical protein
MTNPSLNTKLSKMHTSLCIAMQFNYYATRHLTFPQYCCPFWVSAEFFYNGSRSLFTKNVKETLFFSLMRGTRKIGDECGEEFCAMGEERNYST